MKKHKPKSSAKNQFPKGWNEKRVREVIAHYENQTDEEATVELEAAMSDPKYTMMRVPVELVPAVRKLIAKRVG
jgi:hypothetical protein